MSSHLQFFPNEQHCHLYLSPPTVPSHHPPAFASTVSSSSPPSRVCVRVCSRQHAHHPRHGAPLIVPSTPLAWGTTMVPSTTPSCICHHSWCPIQTWCVWSHLPATPRCVFLSLVGEQPEAATWHFVALMPVRGLESLLNIWRQQCATSYVWFLCLWLCCSHPF